MPVTAEDFRRLTLLRLLLELLVGLCRQRSLDPSMMAIRQGADRHLGTASRPPEVITASYGDAGQPMIEGTRPRELLQTEVRPDEYIMDHLFDAVGRYPSAHDAHDVALIPSDQIRETFGLTLANAPEDIALVR